MQLNTKCATEAFDQLDRLSPTELERWWTRRLAAVLKVAEIELPFYTRRFGLAGFRSASFRNLNDLNRLPIINKADLLAAQRMSAGHKLGIERFPERPQPAVTLSLSSGTSGTTFITHTDRWRRLQGRSSCRAHWWAGLRPGTPLILSAPAWHSYASIQPFIARHFGMQCVVVSGTYLPRFADRIVDAIVNFRPSFVTMFLPMVFSIIAAGKRRGLSADATFAGVESLVVTGAPITPGMRRHLKELTGVGRVAELAGSSENLLAVDCPLAGDLHVVPDTCHVEVLDRRTQQPVTSGQRGTLVHSSVIAEGSVYIRYDGGDVATIDRSHCPCGLPSPRIKILGRWEDCFALGPHTMLPYDIQNALEQEVPELTGAAFVIVREALAEGRLRLLAIEPRDSASVLLDGARYRLSRRLGVPVEVCGVRALPLRFKGVAPIVSERAAIAVDS